MKIDKTPIDPADVIGSHAPAFFSAISTLDPFAGEGGITLHRKGDWRPRALVYWGPLPKWAEGVLRLFIPPGFELSHVRNDDVRHQTATGTDRRGY